MSCSSQNLLLDECCGVFFTQLKGSAASVPSGSNSNSSSSNSEPVKSSGEGQRATVNEKEKSPVMTAVVDKDGMYVCAHKRHTWVYSYIVLILLHTRLCRAAGYRVFPGTSQGNMGCTIKVLKPWDRTRSVCRDN